MMLLTKHKVIPYLQMFYPDLPQIQPLQIHALGEQEGDTVGLINHVYRVSWPSGSLIVKQGQPNIRSAQDFTYLLPPERSHTEAVSLKLRRSILPQYVPQVYLEDRKNCVLVMEDVSRLPLCRAALSQGQEIPDLGWRCGQFMAETAFYTSEFYLPRTTFRSLAQAFPNHEMRRVMEEWTFFRRSPYPPAPETRALEEMLRQPELASRIYLLRQHYMSHGEALIHSDLHTGNVFAHGEEMKVIDMEYTFAGPCAYDLGYFLSSLVCLYCASYYLPLPQAQSPEHFRRYLLETIAQLFLSHRQHFLAAWEQDAKEEYRSCPQFAERFLDGLLPEAVGYCAAIALTLSTVGPTLEEVKRIPRPEDRQAAIALTFATAQYLLLSYENIRTLPQLLQAIDHCAQGHCPTP